MIERLLESWLDNASERSYQAPFCQMLLADGHRIVHSSRHSAIEFGKDVVTLAPDGSVCAYQLKGKPGGRFTGKEFQSILPQLLQLVTGDVSRPEVPSGARRRNILVTNALFEEEAAKALDEFNRGLPAGYQKLEVLSRGDLLDAAKRLGTALWPAELADANALLELLVSSGRDVLPLERLDALLTSTLALQEDANKPSAESVLRRITSAAVLTSIGLKTFSEEQNHLAVARAWVLCAVYICAAGARWNVNDARLTAAVDIAVEAALAELAWLTEEVRSAPDTWDRATWFHPLLRNAVFTEVTGWLSLYWVESQRTGWRNEEHRECLRSILPSDVKRLALWGEGALPQWLAWIWFLRGTEGDLHPEQQLVSLLALLLRTNGPSAKLEPLASPYYDLSEILRHRLPGLTPREDDHLARDTPAGGSFFVKTLLHLVARAGRKRTCQDAWPEYTRIAHREFRPADAWRFCVIKTGHGQELSEHVPLAGRWADLYAEARGTDTPGVPQSLRERPFLLAAFAMTCPWRATPAVLRYLSNTYYGPPFFG